MPRVGLKLESVHAKPYTIPLSYCITAERKSEFALLKVDSYQILSFHCYVTEQQMKQIQRLILKLSDQLSCLSLQDKVQPNGTDSVELRLQTIGGLVLVLQVIISYK